MHPCACFVAIDSRVYNVKSKFSLGLQAAGITKERLASFDRAIRSEPNFKPEQCAGLLKDLQAYLITLKVKPCIMVSTTQYTLLNHARSSPQV